MLPVAQRAQPHWSVTLLGGQEVSFSSGNSVVFYQKPAGTSEDGMWSPFATVPVRNAALTKRGEKSLITGALIGRMFIPLSGTMIMLGDVVKISF